MCKILLDNRERRVANSLTLISFAICESLIFNKIKFTNSTFHNKFEKLDL